MSMPRWQGLTLGWGGTALAVVAAAGLISVEFLVPTAGEPPAETTAPVDLYWILLVIGVSAAVIGFVGARAAKLKAELYRRYKGGEGEG